MPPHWRPCARSPCSRWPNGWLKAAQSPCPRPRLAEDLAAVVYTSGTTGKPKGVMLTHRNVVSNVQAVMQRLQPRSDDVFLSFLPLSHTFERTAGYYLALAVGACVAYARSVAQLAEDLKTQRPTVLVSVPRIYERVHAKVMETLARAPLKAQLFGLAQARGWQRFCETQGIADAQAPQPDVPGWMQWLPWPVLNHLVAKPLLAQFGGRVRVAVSGGAPLSPTIARCFLGLGLPLIQGYGMTETSPVVCANTLEDNHPATVGRALPGVEVRIGENRELQVRGPLRDARLLGAPRRHRQDLHRRRLGWRTGDQAVIEDGRVRIQGRIKEIIVTSTGEKIPPADLELAITGDPFFTQVFGRGRRPPLHRRRGRDRTRRMAGHGPAPGPGSRRPQEPEPLRRRTRGTGTHRKAGGQLCPLCCATRRASGAGALDHRKNGLMTPTLKLKRNNLMTRFESQIAAMYSKPAERWQGRNSAG